MIKEQLIQDFVEKFATYLDSTVKNTMLVLTGREDLEFQTSASWNYAHLTFVSVYFSIGVTSIVDSEGYVAGTGTYGFFSFRYYPDFKDIDDSPYFEGIEINDAAMIKQLRSEELANFIGGIHIYAQGFRSIKPIRINLKDETVLREQLDEYYPVLISYIESQIQDMADAILAFIDYYQEGDIIPEA